MTAYDQLMLDLFTTALEGGIGYWSQCTAYHWRCDDDSAGEDYKGFYADIVEIESDDDDNGWQINRETMTRGYKRATSPEWRNKIRWSSDTPPVVVPSTFDIDWDFDAGDADVIVQLGLFNEVRYG